MDKKEIKFFDKNIYRKASIIKNSLQFMEKTEIPLPSVIEISDSGTCNRSCGFCPRSDPEWITEFDKKEFITTELHEKICKQLGELNYSGMIIYSGFNEPLLNKSCYKNIKRTREYVPSSKIELITNGDVLNESRLKRLFEAGLDTILISAYDSKESAEELRELCLKCELKEKEQFLVRHRYLPEEQDFGITMSNRAGYLKNTEYKIEELKSPAKRPCYYPGYYFFIDYNGDVLMCSHDWGKKNILGNLNKSSLKDIWMSQNSHDARDKLFNGKRTFQPCNKCDVSGDLIGGKHFDQWRKYYGKK
tara:strand:- start:1513 stop:2427 length:915 start_codon:yes stop_codon:yes gene_type:complete